MSLIINEIKVDDEELNKFIENYINTEYQQNTATFISAKWGMGKTTFINKLIEKLESKKYKSVVINVWEEEWENRFFTKLYKNLFPRRYRLSELSTFILITVFSAIILFLQIFTNSENSKLWSLVITLVLFSSITTTLLNTFKEIDPEEKY